MIFSKNPVSGLILSAFVMIGSSNQALAQCTRILKPRRLAVCAALRRSIPSHLFDEEMNSAASTERPAAPAQPASQCGLSAQSLEAGTTSMPAVNGSARPVPKIKIWERFTRHRGKSSKSAAHAKTAVEKNSVQKSSAQKTAAHKGKAPAKSKSRVAATAHPPAKTPAGKKMRKKRSTHSVKSALSKIKKRTFSGNVSWYGRKFHGKRTASGKKFDMHKLVCAHKSLPFGTKVLVENPKTGDSVVVEVVDRGPFVDHRVMDLSRAAARRLGILTSGVAFVDCTVLRN